MTASICQANRLLCCSVLVMLCLLCVLLALVVL